VAKLEGRGSGLDLARQNTNKNNSFGLNVEQSNFHYLRETPEGYGYVAFGGVPSDQPALLESTLWDGSDYRCDQADWSPHHADPVSGVVVGGGDAVEDQSCDLFKHDHNRARFFVVKTSEISRCHGRQGWDQFLDGLKA
jgi:hypothetical protein